MGICAFDQSRGSMVTFSACASPQGLPEHWRRRGCLHRPVGDGFFWAYGTVVVSGGQGGASARAAPRRGGAGRTPWQPSHASLQHCRQAYVG
jgi:hypothetical protein